MTVIWFTHGGNNELIDAVRKAGFDCCIVTSEILIRELVAQYTNSIVIIGHDIPPDRAHSVQQQFPMLTINETAKTANILYELGLIMSRQKPVN